ncbi:DUF1516 family protein [Synoicihabitans lomoniglobus]|uniref:Uncharacterized protein n=1 Tax=Synoicihabitans lomoniglobus TaxID=2909285 RepID=A0AAF0CSN0_9BACT|nr:hypothetical protein [Opitutaceae bacterium LMO-M01]WED67310.1 hypothetical protein PXH66_10655 [Opitutaceae bacterium LMO-M01]
MSPTFYHILHLLSLVVLTGGTFYGFAGAADTRKKVMIFSGIASVLMLVSGFGLLSKLSYGFPGWAIVKIVCWLGLSALMGIGYRKRDKAGLFMGIILALVFIALVMVYQRPF